MSQTSSASGLVRVTVASGTRRVDLVLPGAVPVAELVPELARGVGLLDSATVHGGYRVVTGAGRLLEPDAGLIVQGVEDGGVLTVSAGVHQTAPKVYDDVVEAMADVVESDLVPWRPENARRSTLAASAVLMLLAAFGLGTRTDSLGAAWAALGTALLLVLVGIVLSRRWKEWGAGVVACHLGAVHAAVGGMIIGAADGWSEPFGAPLAGAGIAAGMAGLAGVVGVNRGRALMIPPIVLGTVAAVAGGVVVLLEPDPAVLLSCVMTFLVLAGSLLPWLALSVTRTTVGEPETTSTTPAPVNPDRVRSDAQVAHEILLAVTVVVGVVVVLVAPLAVSRGVGGTLLALTCCLVLVLRTRQYRATSEVVAGLVTGLAAVVSVTVSVLVLQPGMGGALAVGLALVGALLLASTFFPSGNALGQVRIGDVTESVALLALLPLLAIASGLVEWIAG